MNNNIIIRHENKDEEFLVENLVRDSFFNVYRPGALEHFVLHKLRTHKDFIKELNFVLLIDDKIIGQNVFVKTNIKLDNGKNIPIATMGPICIHNDFKRNGYGKMLLDYSLEKAKEYGIGAVCFEGNIDFYGKSGFTYAKDFGIRYFGLSPDDDSSFFLCKELKEGYLKDVSGIYSTPEVYLVDEQEAEEYDKKFPFKKKLKLSTQIFWYFLNNINLRGVSHT